MTLSQQERLEGRRSDRAFMLLNGPLFWRFVHALDLCGWKIVRQDPEDADRPLVPWGSKRKHWPNWIEDWRSKDAGPPYSDWPSDEEQTPTLRVIEGGKPDD
jgi:hypothetical protein